MAHLLHKIEAKMKRLTNEEVAKATDYVFIDIRNSIEFSDGFVMGSINMLPDENFRANIRLFAGTRNEMVLICNVADDLNTLNIAGAENIKGYITINHLSDTMQRDMIIDILPDELLIDLQFDDHLILLDVRTAIDFRNGHLAGAINMPLEDFADPAKIATIDENANVYIYGNHSNYPSLPASVLKKQGIENVRIISNGWEAISNEPNAMIEKEANLLN